MYLMVMLGCFEVLVQSLTVIRNICGTCLAVVVQNGCSWFVYVEFKVD